MIIIIQEARAVREFTFRGSTIRAKYFVRHLLEQN